VTLHERGCIWEQLAPSGQQRADDDESSEIQNWPLVQQKFPGSFGSTDVQEVREEFAQVWSRLRSTLKVWSGALPSLNAEIKLGHTQATPRILKVDRIAISCENDRFMRGRWKDTTQ